MIKKILSAMLIVLLMQVQSLAVVIPQGTMVVVQPQRGIDADNVKIGETVRFRVAQPVKIKEQVVIKSDTEVLADVVTKSNNFILGKPGKLGLNNFRIITLNNESIPLNGQMLDEGEGRYWANIGWFLLFPLLFIKGDDGKFNVNVSQTLFTLEDVEI